MLLHCLNRSRSRTVHCLCQQNILPGAVYAVTSKAAADSSLTPTDNTRSSTWWTTVSTLILGMAAAAVATASPVLADSTKLGSTSLQAATAAAAVQEDADGITAGGKLLPLAMRQRIFFKYEKRIRDLSTLEKIYEYFATHEHNGVKVMTSADVVRALVPTYPPEGSTVERAGFLDGERGHCQETSKARQQLLHFFDHDRSGTLDFNEFVLIVVCLSVPEKDIEAVFDTMDLDNNGVVDEHEFHQVLEQLERRAGIQQGFHNRAGKHPIVGLDEREMTHKLFQDQGSGVHLNKFRAFLQRLQEGMLKLEFAHYDMHSKGVISGVDFARSLVTAADVRHVDHLLDKADALPAELYNAKISYKDFKTMAQLRTNIYLLSFALDFCFQIQRPLNRVDFAKLVQKTCSIKLPPLVLDIVMHMFGDKQGALDGPQFVAVMKQRNKVPGYKHGPGQQEQEGPSSTPVLTWFKCVKDCTLGPNDSRA